MAEIETRLFRYFVALAEEQHFSRAALRLKISPPTLTHQIKKLEHELGAKLLERKGNTHVLLTEAGLQFFEHARGVLRQIAEARSIAQRAEHGEVGSIEIGYMMSATLADFLHGALGEFQKANPAIELNLHKLVPMAQISGIIRKDLDVGFTRGPHKFPYGVDSFEILRHPMVLALPRSHPLAERNKIDPATLKDEAFVNTGPELDVGFFGHTEAVASAGNFTPRVVKRDDDMVTVLSYVSIGYGIAVVPQAMCKVDFPNIVYRELAMDPVPTSSVTFAYRRNDTSRSAKRLTEHMRRYALPR